MKEVFLKLHLSIFIAGFTGVFGKLISVNEGFLVLYRMAITSVLLFLFLNLTKKLVRLKSQDIIKVAGVGLLLGLHWLFFYGSIKAANVSIGVICFSLVGCFTAVFEPLIFRRGLSIKELSYSLLTVAGILLIFQFDSQCRFGILLGVVSSAFAALFTICNKKVSGKCNSINLLFYEIIGGLALLCIAVPIYIHHLPQVHYIPTKADILYLLILSVICTIVMYILQIQVLKKVSAFTVNLSYNLEPIYSIILAMILFGEAKDLNPAFYIGLSLILLSVALKSLETFKGKSIVESPTKDYV